MKYSYNVLVFWEQPGLQLGGHKIQISRGPQATLPAVERHFRDMIERYGKVTAVNLLGQKEGSTECVLADAYSQQIRSMNMSNYLRLHNFDFHHVVKGNQFENLNQLVSDLRDQIKEMGYFLLKSDSREVLQQQIGIFRTNCLDCLDRSELLRQDSLSY
jgi:hypothetical protein